MRAAVTPSPPPSSTPPLLDPEPEEHADHDGYEHEPHQRQAQAHQIGHGTCGLRSTPSAALER